MRSSKARLSLSSNCVDVKRENSWMLPSNRRQQHYKSRNSSSYLCVQYIWNSIKLSIMFLFVFYILFLLPLLTTNFRYIHPTFFPHRLCFVCNVFLIWKRFTRKFILIVINEALNVKQCNQWKTFKVKFWKKKKKNEEVKQIKLDKNALLWLQAILKTNVGTKIKLKKQLDWFGKRITKNTC